MDLLTGRVVDDPGAGRGERVTTKVRRPSLGAVAPDRDDLVAGIRIRPRRDVQLRVVEARDECQPVGATTERGRADLRNAGRIDEGHALAGRDGDPGNVVDADARQSAIRDRRVESLARVAGPGAAQDDRAAQGTLGEARFIVGWIPRQQARQGAGEGRRVTDLIDFRDQRGTTATGREVGDAGQVQTAPNVARRKVHDGQAADRGRDDRGAVAGHQQVHDGVIDGCQQERLTTRIDTGAPQGGQIDGRDLAGRVPDDELVAGRVDRQRRCTRSRHDRDECPRAQVVGPDLGAGGDVQPLAASASRREWVVPARFDDGRLDRHAQVAGGFDLILAPQDQATGHRVLGEVWMGPFVDVVRQAVAPGLQELGRGPGVVDLVEVHLVRLGEPEGAQEHRRDDEHDEEPQVQPVETAATLGSKRRAAVRTDGRFVQACLEPAADTELRVGRTGRPGRERRGDDRPRIRLANDRRRQRGPGHDAGGGLERGLERLVFHQRPCLLVCQVPRQPIARPGTKLGECPQEDNAIDQRHDRDSRLGPDHRPDPKPVADPRVLVERVRQDRVHVEEDRPGQHEIDHPPAPRDGREDDRQREYRVGVALVDAGGNDVEGQGEQGQAEEDREAVRAPRSHERDDERHDQHQHAPDQDRRDATQERDARAASVWPPGTVADPQSGVGEAVAGVTGHEGPRVERVDRQVRIARRGGEDLGDQAGLQVRRLEAELQHGQSKGQTQQDGRDQGHDGGRDDAGWMVSAALPG